MRVAVRAIKGLELVSLTLDAANEAEARAQAERDGYDVLATASRRGPILSVPRGAALPLLQFNQSLLILLRAGLSVVEAIETLADRETKADAKRVLSLVHAELTVGRSFSAALEKQPLVFPPLYVASVRANEKTGAIAEAVERFVAYRAQADVMRKRIVSAAIYPAIVLSVGVLVIAFLLLYVVPRFATVFQDMGDRIPLMSRLLLDWGRFAQAHWTGLLVAAASAIAAAVYALRQPAVQMAVARAIQRLPRIGEYVRIYQLARFYRALGMLQEAGIPIATALAMVEGLLPPSLRPALAAAGRDVREGRSISQALEARGLTTVVSLRLLRVAEKTGRMGEMLMRTATFHDDDIAQAIDWFVRLFEPLLMLAIGMVIGVVVLLMYAPIFELAGSIQ